MHVVEALSQRSAEVGEETGDGRTAGGGGGVVGGLVVLHSWPHVHF